MSRVTVIEFVSLDGVMQDPDGSGGTAWGGWAFRYGPASTTGDPFKLGELLDTGTLLLGRATWQLFARVFPRRTDDFDTKMNAMPKRVVSHSLVSVAEWNNSTLVEADLVDDVRSQLAHGHDLVVMGSASVARALMQHNLVDEYRLLVFPIVLGQGAHLFEPGDACLELELVGSEQVGAAALLRYQRAMAH